MTGPVLVGRSEELATIAALVDRAIAGEAGALLISGDPGVGKTALVQQACADVGPEVLVLYGAALPLTTMSVPFLALRSAVRNQARSEGGSFFQPGQPLVDVPIGFDDWLGDRCRQSPVVLVIDDLHWADQSTLDVLMYLLAGPADRRLAVIATMRSSAVDVGHPLQRWLADIRRLPRIEQLMLEPFDLVTTDAQLTALLGVPHRSLVEEVFRHTLGNAYLNRLLVVGVDPRARHLPGDLPADLKSAMMQSWRRLSPPTRELARVLAVAGRPMHANELDAVVGRETGPGGVSSMLREAAENGILDARSSGTYWFHHPMSAEVLEQGLPDDERHRLHSVFAEFYEFRLADTPEPGVDLMVALADHHHQAGHHIEAYRWALSASAAVGRAGGAAEMLRLLRRAVTLREQVPEATETRQDLLLQLRTAAAKTGEQEEELQAVEAMLDDLDRSAEPLLAAELLVRRMQLRFLCGRAFLTSDEMREAVRLAAVDPHSWQHALALAELAHAESWEDSSGEAAHADHALTLARSAGDPRALTYALTANAVVAIKLGKRQEGVAFAVEALAAALLAGDYWAFCHAATWEARATAAWPSRIHPDMLRRRREELVSLGAPYTYIATLSAAEVSSRFSIGDWRECVLCLRAVLGSDPAPLADFAARLAAARLAAWQGRPDEAESHLERADEIFAASSSFINFESAACRAEVCLAAGKPAEAFDAAMAGANSPGVAPTMCEWLMPLAARAIADQVQTVRDAGSNPVRLLAQLDDLTERFPSVITDTNQIIVLGESHRDALNQLYAAEIGRAHRDPDNGEQWIRTAEASRAATLAWEEAYSWWRAAEALLVHGHHREQAASALRSGLDLAEKLQARAILSELENLAGTARIRVDRVVRVSEPPKRPTDLAGLTAREREILSHIVAGRTYGEIARALVISEKTVSSHVSNLLRKTGTSNRVDLSRLATSAARLDRI